MIPTVAAVRARCGDRLRWNANRAISTPEILAAHADGVQTDFYLRFPIAALDSVRVYFGTATVNQRTEWELVDPVANPWAALADSYGLSLVRFSPAPPSGAAVGARYLMSAFSDAELQEQIDAVGDSPSALDRIHLALIPAMLNRDACLVTRNGDLVQDPQGWVNAQLALQRQLNAQLLQGSPPDISGPEMGIGYTGRQCW